MPRPTTLPIRDRPASRLRLTREQVAVVHPHRHGACRRPAARPARCGFPDGSVDGHACPRSNGHRRPMTPATVLDSSRHRRDEVLGRMPELQRHVARRSSATTAGETCRGVYKPERGERPLWDFPPGLCRARGGRLRAGRAPRLGRRARRPSRVTTARSGPGSVQLFVEADFEEHYFTLFEDERHHADLQTHLRVRHAGQQHRPQERALPGRPRRAIWAIDNGLCFPAEFKLRTVIWEFGGDDHPRTVGGRRRPFLATRAARRRRRLLDDVEQRALLARARAVVADPLLPDRPHRAAATPGRWSEPSATSSCGGWIRGGDSPVKSNASPASASNSTRSISSKVPSPLVSRDVVSTCWRMSASPSPSTSMAVVSRTLPQVGAAVPVDVDHDPLDRADGVGPAVAVVVDGGRLPGAEAVDDAVAVVVDRERLGPGHRARACRDVVRSSDSAGSSGSSSSSAIGRPAAHRRRRRAPGRGRGWRSGRRGRGGGASAWNSSHRG